jgi:DNA repair exonuclease SbcCD ATPase subunit
LAAELGPLVEKLRLKRDEAATAREQIEAKQATLDRRLVEVGRTELALQKRVEELNQLEVELRAELEQRERELERQRVALAEEVRAARRVPVPVDRPTPPPIPKFAAEAAAERDN